MVLNMRMIFHSQLTDKANQTKSCMYVCVCVYLYSVCMYFCMYVSMYLYMYVWMYVCMYIYSVCMYVSMYLVCMYSESQKNLRVHERATRNGTLMRKCSQYMQCASARMNARVSCAKN